MPQKETSQRQHSDGDGAVHIDPSMSRLDRIEAALELVQQTLDVQFRRMADMQAELDLMKAKRRRSG